MALPTFPLMINGDEFSAVSAQIDILGDICKGVKGLSWKQSAPRESVQGTGQVAVALAKGAYSIESELTLFKSWADIFESKLAQRGATLFGPGTAWGDVPFDITIRYVEKRIGGTKISTIELRTVFVDDDDESFEAGRAGGVEVKYALKTARPIRKNGLTRVKDPFGDQTTAMVAGIQAA